MRTNTNGACFPAGPPLLRRVMYVLLAIATSSLVTSCGTLEHRGGSRLCGYYPYWAPATDVEILVMAERADTWTGEIGLRVVALCSIPPDVLIDTVFLPFDIGYGLAGERRTNIFEGLH